MDERNGVYVIGAGGHGKVVVAALQASHTNVIGILDDRDATWGGSICGVPVQGPSSLLADVPDAEAFLAIGDNYVRRTLSERFTSVRWITVIHPTACVHSSVRVGAGTLVCAGAVIQPDTTIGAHVIVNTSATVDHDCTLGDFVHIAPGAHLAGGVMIGTATLLGIGSSVIPCRSIGSDTVIGAGSIVVDDIPSGVAAWGVPARVQGARL